MSQTRTNRGPQGRYARLGLLAAACALLATGCLNQQPAEKPAPDIEKIAITGGDHYDIIASREPTQDNRVKLLLDGPQTYDSMFEAIAQATDHINLETFILADDVIGERLAAALIERAAAGVVVNVIYDALGSGMTANEFFDKLRDGGINLVAYNPVLDIEIWKVATRTHRKLLIVDGRIGFTGGLNFTNKYRYSSENPPPDERFGEAWRDTHIRIEGPAVAELQRAFMRTWVENADGEDLVAANYFPEIEPAGDDTVLVVVAEGGDAEPSPIFEHYVAAVRAAKQRVWITQAYFIPSEDLLDALTDAARRGVDVRLILPKRTDNGLTIPATRSYYTRLLEAGARVFEYNHTHLHAKTALIDDTWSTVGSSNLDTLSYLYNHELNAIMLDEDFNAELASSFEDDMTESLEITPEQWASRGLWPRAKELFARMLKPIL